MVQGLVAFVVLIGVCGAATGAAATDTAQGRGEQIYSQFCSTCHGSYGNGKGFAAEFLPDSKPRDITSAAFVIEGREEQIAQFISAGAAAATHGSTYMPVWASRLSPQQISDTVEYLKKSKTPAR